MLVLTEEQNMLREAAAGFLAGRASPVQLRALRDAGDELAFDPAVWQEMVEMGWAGIAIPEAYGGLGYGYTGLGVVLQEIGRQLSPSPMQGSVLLGATALLTLGDETSRSAWLPKIAAGEAQVAFAHQETSRFDPLAVATSARREGDGWVLSGRKCLVVDALSADAFLVIARSAGAAGESAGLSVFLVPAASTGLTVTRSDMVDSRQYGSLALDDLQLPASALMGEAGEAWPALQRCLDIAAIGFAAELLGLSLEAFERTMVYLRERKQFGRVIGSFQGLQHRAAMLFAELELARSIVLKALHAIDDDSDDLSLLASAAKAKLCEVAQLASNEGIQMHGGIGMTDEYDIGFFLKRARVLQHLAGDEYYHLDRFARLGGF
jgi:acyl-CoA dehydrogenase